MNYVGTVLPKEVTFCNLNNNINDTFLHEMCGSYGVVDSVAVYYHPKTRRHLGIGTVTESQLLKRLIIVCVLFRDQPNSRFHGRDIFREIGPLP